MDAIKMRYSVVMCSQYNVSDDTPCVIIDDYAAAKSAISYLLSIGRTQIAMINAKLHHSYAQLRERAYMDALEEAGVSARPGWIAHIASIDYEMAYSAAINMLSASDRPDAVFLSLIHIFVHLEHFRKAVTAGKPILCEKPMGMSAEETREMTELAKQHGIFLMEGLWTRFFPVYQWLNELMKEGSLGPVSYTHLDFRYRRRGQENR